jgi:hypothetical protein
MAIWHSWGAWRPWRRTGKHYLGVMLRPGRFAYGLVCWFRSYKGGWACYRTRSTRSRLARLFWETCIMRSIHGSSVYRLR